MKRYQIFVMAVALQVLCFYPAIAQQFNMSPDPVDTRMSIGLKVKKPFYKNSEYSDNPSGLSGVYKLYGNFPLKKNWQINAEVPLVVSRIEDFNETGLANLILKCRKPSIQLKQPGFRWEYTSPQLMERNISVSLSVCYLIHIALSSL